MCYTVPITGQGWQSRSLSDYAAIYYKIHKYIQELEPTTLKYKMIIEKAKVHERNCLKYKDHQASHGGVNSAPSYNNPLLYAHAITKSRPSGQNTCHQCGKSHKQGNCPAYGKVCGKCQGPNHFKAIWHSKVTAVKTAPSPFKKKQSQPLLRRTSMGSNSGNGKGGRQFPKKKKTPQKPPKQKIYKVMSKNTVPSEMAATSGGENGKVLQNLVLSRPDKEGMYNRFSYYAVNSRLAQNTNAKSKLLERLYTDTDPDNRSEIITDITIRVPGKPGTMMMEVKVDPGAQPSCIPLYKFKILFSHLCRDGLPKEGLLDNTHNEFESYNGGDFTCYGHLTIDVQGQGHQEVSSH